MKPVFTRPATPDDIRQVALRLREDDRREVRAVTGLDPLLALHPQGLEGRWVQTAGIVRPEILFGVDPVFDHPEVGLIWLLGTDEVFANPVEFAVTSRRIFDDIHSRYPVLTNFMDARNTRHRKFVEWLGFRVLRTIPAWGAESRPFHEFVSYRPCVHSPPH